VNTGRRFKAEPLQKPLIQLEDSQITQIPIERITKNRRKIEEADQLSGQPQRTARGI
jgi:hypothetical protein